MPRLKVLSGEEIVKILKSFGFEIVAQKGSHIKMRREKSGLKQTLTIPNHKEIDRGTLKAIYNQSVRYISEIELRSYFYTD